MRFRCLGWSLQLTCWLRGKNCISCFLYPKHNGNCKGKQLHLLLFLSIFTLSKHVFDRTKTYMSYCMNIVPRYVLLSLDIFIFQGKNPNNSRIWKMDFMNAFLFGLLYNNNNEKNWEKCGLTGAQSSVYPASPPVSAGIGSSHHMTLWDKADR